ncbi:MAG: alpha/beta fold hydrolase [Acetobacteraceae bacterium]|nr:alpha/beta fold hydrolase [Acetobacteraceae bacterium]
MLTKLDAYWGAFQVGGQYTTIPGLNSGNPPTDEQASLVMDGAMYVNYIIPYTVTHPYPIILIHGGVGTGQAFLSTPDGRTGWAQYLANQGFAVYVVDQPARGRSIYHPQLDGTVGNNSVLSMEQQFTASQDFDLWPQAHLHTQWPGSGLQGDPTFDNFMRGTNGATPDEEALDIASGAALIDKIGPAIVLGRSQSGIYPFHYADVRPGQVKAMIDIEGAAPAFNCPYPPSCQTYNGVPSTLTPLWGVTTQPITYSPPITDPVSQLVRVPNSAPAGPNEATCWRQGAPVHKLLNLQGIPTMVMVSQSSFAAQTEVCMHQYLEQAGVKNDLIRLQDVGLKGNGHLMNVELNSDQIAQFLIDWLASYGL